MKLLQHPAAPYIAPFGVYMLFLMVEQNIHGSVYYLYPVKALAVAATLVWAWRGVRDAMQSRAGLVLGSLVGVLALLVWIAPELLRLTQTNFARGGFNPNKLHESWAAAGAACRMAGAVLVVPLMEELFWRGWLIRWLMDEDFKSVPVGAFSWKSFGITVAMFGLEHGALWHVGMITGALYNGLLYRTRSLWACVLAHAVTNLLLAVYVLATGKWGYW
jgi:hypothetical protein